jgi:DNA-binding Lrp family transcriptional regulator
MSERSMTVSERILAMLEESAPRTNSDFARSIYGDSSVNSKVKIGHRLRRLEQRGLVRSERTGPSSNATILYWPAEQKTAAEEDPIQILEKMGQAEEELVALSTRIGQLRVALQRALR